MLFFIIRNTLQSMVVNSRRDLHHNHRNVPLLELAYSFQSQPKGIWGSIVTADVRALRHSRYSRGHTGGCNEVRERRCCHREPSAVSGPAAYCVASLITPRAQRRRGAAAMLQSRSIAGRSHRFMANPYLRDRTGFWIIRTFRCPFVSCLPGAYQARLSRAWQQRRFAFGTVIFGRPS